MFFVKSLSCFLLLCSMSAYGAEYVVQKEESVFAVLTHKAGIASAFAHDHFVVAKNFEVRIDADEKAQTGTFELKAPAADLEVDNPDAQKRWFPNLEKLALMTKPFASASKSDRDKVRDNMLANDQLDAKKFPEIAAKLEGIEKAETKVGKQTYDFLFNVAVTVHGKSVKQKVPGTLRFSGNVLEAEAVGNYKFSEFGIKPFSGMLGAVKNQDAFQIYVSLKADKK